MAKIKITRGFYGLRVKIGKLIVNRTKGPNDDAFEVDDNEAKRLVDLGVAKYVDDTPVATVEESADEDNASVNTPETKAPAESENEGGSSVVPPETTTENKNDGDDETDIPEYSIETNAKELRKIAESVGITFKVGVTKEDMVKALDEYFGVMDAPDLSAETPVV